MLIGSYLSDSQYNVINGQLLDIIVDHDASGGCGDGGGIRNGGSGGHGLSGVGGGAYHRNDIRSGGGHSRRIVFHASLSRAFRDATVSNSWKH